MVTPYPPEPADWETQEWADAHTEPDTTPLDEFLAQADDAERAEVTGRRK